MGCRKICREIVADQAPFRQILLNRHLQRVKFTRNAAAG